MDTEALVFLGSLDPEAIGPHLAYATHYEPVPIGDFGTLLDAVPLQPRDATFVDLGCGMGRALLLAARRPFRQVVGIEISPALCAVARDNLRAYQGPLACRDLRVIRADAAERALPKGPLVVFLYNPFRGPVLEATVERLAAHDQACAVVYHTPVERGAFDRAGFKAITEFPFGLVLERT